MDPLPTNLLRSGRQPVPKEPSTPVKRKKPVAKESSTAGKPKRAAAPDKRAQPVATQKSVARPTNRVTPPAKRAPVAKRVSTAVKPKRAAVPAKRAAAPTKVVKKSAGAPRKPAKKATSGAAHMRRLLATSGPEVTDRDVDMLRWIGLHGVVSPEQIAAHFFGRVDGSTGSSAAYRRLRKLEQLKLVKRDHTFYREPSVIRLTGIGADLADAGVGPARLVLAEVHHCLAVVDLTEQLLQKHKGATLTTERQLRIERRRALADHSRRPGEGRIPDAVLTIGRKAIAVELDLTPKRTNDLEKILRAYLREKYDAVWWYALPRVVSRLRDIVKSNRADDLVTVHTWTREG